MHVFGQAETDRLEKRGGVAMADMAKCERNKPNHRYAGGMSLPEICPFYGGRPWGGAETPASPSSRRITINDQTNEGNEKEEEGEVVCLTEVRGLTLQNDGLLNLITQIKLPAAMEPNRHFVKPSGGDIALVVPLRAWCHPDAGDITRRFIKLRRYMEVHLSQNHD